ncbi:hypothetical protein DFJ74DRAFT_695659 [Hyaloraphidium curvatum]|nr:hypothetical protein DFJ74DRAFT_695659 [Hyaloraphidium curvatum]
MPALALRDLLSGDMLDALLSHLQASHPAQMPLLGFLLDLEALDGLPPAAAASDGERIFSAHFGPGSRMAGLVESGVIARIREGLALGEPGVWEEARRWAAEVLERECLLRCEVVPGYRYVREGPRRGASAEGRAGGGGEAAIAEDLAGVLARSAGALPGPVPRRRTTPGPTPRGSRAGSPSRGVVPGAVAVLDPAGTPRSSTDSNPSVPTDPAEARKRMGVLQEQIAAVQDAAIRILRTDPGSSRLAQLKRTKNSMEAELARVKRVVEDADGQLTPSRILFGAQVRVRDLEGPRDEEAGAGSAWTLQRLKETFVTAGAGIAPAAAARAAGRAIVYSVEVSSRGTAMRHGWAITRRWSDFVLLQEKLASQHAKVSKIGFPTRQRLTSETDAEARARLAGELERFLSTLLIDSKLCESFVLQTFLQPELVNFEEALDNGGSELEHPLAVFADAFRSVGTGVTEAASLIGLGVNEAVSAVSSFGSGAASVVGAGVGAVGSGVVGAVKAPISAAGSLLKGMTSSKAGQSSQEAARGIGKQNSFSSQLMGTFGGFTGAANGPADPFSSRPASNSSSTVPSPSRTPTVVPASQATAMEQALAPAGSGSGASTPSRSTAEYVRSSGSIGDKPPEDMYNVDPDLVLDLAFSLLEEVFDVAAVRQTSLNIIKSVLRQTHRETIRMAASRLIYAVAHDDSVAAQIQGILARFWPDGIFYAHNPNFVPPPVRTPEQREATKLEAKRLLMQDSDPFGIMLTLDRLVGRYARVMGLIRLFNCLQSDEGLLNKGLICAVLEVVAKALLVGVEEVREAEVVERPDRAYGAKQAKGADMAL